MSQPSEEIENIIGQLERYGGLARPEAKFIEVLWALVELNDNIWHGRSREICQEDVDKAKRALDAIMKENAWIWEPA